jgi:hypothetical protein
MPHNRRHFLAFVLFRLKHISVLPSAIIYSNRSLFGNCQALNDQSESYIGARQSKQLHQVPKASDSDASHGRHFVLYMPSSISGIYTLDYLGSVRNNHEIAVV